MQETQAIAPRLSKLSREQLSKVRVVLRVLDFSLAREHDFLAEVMKYNNTQNAIKISDFRSNDPVQKDLARKFDEVSRAGKRYWYKRTVTGTVNLSTIEQFGHSLSATWLLIKDPVVAT